MVVALLAAAPALGEDATVAAWRSADGETRAFALQLARRSFDTYVSTREVVPVPAKLPPLLQRRAAVFVSAMVHGAPRCCMGTLRPTEPSAAAEIISAACAAAGRDRRFPPILKSERRRLVLIVSIVGSPRAIAPGRLGDLDPARDGLAVTFAGRVGVTLSGEAHDVETMAKWARVRAGARERQPVEYSRLDVVRLIEGRKGL
jgi:AMMECR1 domain-containing protein